MTMQTRMMTAGGKMADDASDKAIIYPPLPKKGFVLWHKTRFFVMLLSTLCLSTIMANSLSLNFTVICMQAPRTERMENGTEVEGPIASMFTESEKSWLFSAVALGTIAGTLPISFLMERFGVRKSFAAYGLISAFATLAFPFVTAFGFLRLLRPPLSAGFRERMAGRPSKQTRGVALAMSFSAMGSITAEWSTWKRSGTYVAFISIHLQLGPIFVMPLSGEFCSSAWGWEAVYYVLGTATLLMFVLFVLFYRDNAAKHPFSPLTQPTTSNLACYRNIFTDRAVLGCVLSCFSSNLGYNVFMQYGPQYLHKFGVALCFTTLAFLPAGHPAVAQVFFTGAIVFSGLNCVRCIVLLLPALVSFVAPDHSREQWARILIFVSLLVASAIVFFDITARATPRKWATNCCKAESRTTPAAPKVFSVSLGDDLKTPPVDPTMRV
ncbi:hypothetical protein M3Y99_01027600 [Aphelenchoides fujianensis]|nr:hypothetical protein M3Y99_01027600 [Aphelenchoides fujianensis]